MSIHSSFSRSAQAAALADLSPTTPGALVSVFGLPPPNYAASQRAAENSAHVHSMPPSYNATSVAVALAQLRLRPKAIDVVAPQVMRDYEKRLGQTQSLQALNELRTDLHQVAHELPPRAAKPFDAMLKTIDEKMERREALVNRLQKLWFKIDQEDPPWRVPPRLGRLAERTKAELKAEVKVHEQFLDMVRRSRQPSVMPHLV